MAKAKDEKKKGVLKRKTPKGTNNGGGKKAFWDLMDMDNKIKLVEAWTRDGATDQEIYDRLGVSNNTFYKWKRERPEFKKALSRIKEIVDVDIENAVYKKAAGYDYEEVTRERVFNDETGEYEMIVTKVIKKQQAPDTAAGIFWLKNRKPHVWRDKQQVEHSGAVGVSDLSYLTDDELEKELARLERLNNGRKK